MIVHAGLATIFAIIAPFLISLVRQRNWTTQRVQVTTYTVALVFAVFAVFLEAGEVSLDALTTEWVIFQFAAILTLAQGLYIFLLKKPETLVPWADGTPLQALNTRLLDMGSSAVPPSRFTGGVNPKPGPNKPSSGG